MPQGAFGEEFFGKAVEQGDFFVVFAGELVDGQEAFISVEAEVARVVVGEIPCVGAVADDKYLQEAQQRFAVAVAGVGFVIDDLLHGAAGAYG